MNHSSWSYWHQFLPILWDENAFLIYIDKYFRDNWLLDFIYFIYVKAGEKESYTDFPSIILHRNSQILVRFQERIIWTIYDLSQTVIIKGYLYIIFNMKLLHNFYYICISVFKAFIFLYCWGALCCELLCTMS